MKCAGCSNEAKYLLFSHREPHCTECMLDAMCSVPTEVIDIESYENKLRRIEEVVKRVGQSEVA